jgi:low affinity Fe/Cu permease
VAIDRGGLVRGKDWFSFLAQNAARRAGSSYAFIACCLITGVWLLTGPIFHWSDTWQLIINTLTNIVGLLMLFLIQNTQNREMTAAQLKLDEVIRSLQGAHNVFLNLEDLGEEDLERIRERYSELAVRARQRAQLGHKDTGTPTVEIEIPKGPGVGCPPTRPT